MIFPCVLENVHIINEVISLIFRGIAHAPHIITDTKEESDDEEDAFVAKEDEQQPMMDLSAPSRPKDDEDDDETHGKYTGFKNPRG